MSNQRRVSLRELSAIRIGGTAGAVYYPASVPELRELLAQNPGIPVIGGGTNVFLGSPAALICTRKLSRIIETPAGIRAECGALLAHLFDFAAGVPATVGGGLRMNFGAFGCELRDFLLSAEIWTGQGVKTLSVAELRLDYRASGFTGIVLSALFSRRQLDRQTEYLRSRRAKMPLDKPSLGSIFRNPPGRPAGQLIEAAGLKGYARGDLQVSDRHANVIVNNGAASAADLLALLEHIQRTVRDQTGLELMPEVQYIG